MGQYRLYCLNDSGRFSKSHEITANGDDQALAKAKELKLPVKCELWKRDRLVGKLDPHDA
jgi:hypothetical protein